MNNQCRRRAVSANRAMMRLRPPSKTRHAMLTWIRRSFRRSQPPSDTDRARQLIAAIDRGGIPLDPARVNAIARNLGLEVSPRAPVEQTIERVRAWLQRSA